MKTYKLFAAACAVAMVIFVLVAGNLTPAQAAEDSMPLVHDIKVKGLARINESVVLERISQHPGDPISTGGITADIHELYQSGYFEDIQVEVEAFEGGVRLIYVLTEKPTIRRVEIFGNKIVDDETIEDAITISPGAVTDMALIQDNVEYIIDVYEKKRYPRVKVVPVIRKISEGHVLLTYQIDEGIKVKIDDITFVGNESVSEYRYKKIIKTKQWWMLAGITGAGKYRQEVLTEDLARISDYLHNNGYIKNEISEPVITYKKNNKWMDITINVKEGPQYTRGDVSFKNNILFTSEELEKEFSLLKGDVFSRKTLKQDIASLVDKHSAEGYALANVFPKLRTNDETLVADIVYTVKQGDIYTLGRVDITGNQKTRERVIRREIRMNEGEQFEGKKLKRSISMLSNLNFFGDLQIDSDPDPDTKIMNLGIRVKEKPTGQFNIGAGYSSVERFVGMVDVTFGNFRGAGQVLKVSTEFSSDKTTYSVEFKEPWLFGKPIELSTRIFKSERAYDDYTKDSTGASIGLSRRFLEYWKAGASYTFKFDEVYDISDSASNAVKDLPSEITLGTISPFISRDTRDNFMNPHSGSKNLVSFTYAGVGGETFFYRYRLDSSWIIPVTRFTEFSARGRYGQSGGLRGQALPLYERFYVGGPYSLRGLRRIGPRDDDGNYIGGFKQLLFNFDYTFPLLKEAGLKGDIFFDTGNAFNNSDDLEMRKTGGFGFKWITPIGPLLFYYAKILDQQEGEPDHRWEFAIGSLF